MKKLLHISLTFILTMTIVIMASGVTFRHCQCSGKTTIMIGQAAENASPQQASKCCNKLAKSCMTVSSISLSPTTQMQPTVFHFDTYQPLVAIVNDWHLFNLTPQQVESTRCKLLGKAYSPPRQYLHLLRVLII